MQTSIEWLVRMLYSPVCNGFLNGQRRIIPFDIIERAKEMHKQETIKFGYNCLFEVESSEELTYKKVPEEVYQETFKKD